MRNKNLHEGVQLLEEVLDKKTLKNLETLAGVNEEDIEIFDNGFKFQFERSLRANRCKVIKYHDKIILEFRKVASGLIEGNYDRLVYENVINPSEFQEVFEYQTSIYLSYI